MKYVVTGTVKFIHPKGYGFTKTEDGDVFFHVTGFRQPEVIKYPIGPPDIQYLKQTIKPEDIATGDKIVMFVKEGEKGKSATSWCWLKDGIAAQEELAEYIPYRLIQRRIASGKPYGDPSRHCWVADQHLVVEEVFRGYEYQFKNRLVGQYQIQQFVEDGWVDCPCPFGMYNGGPLFDLPVSWKNTVKVAQ